MSLEFILPKDKKQIERQIRALKIQIQTDIRDKDRAIHEMALTKLQEVYNNEYSR